MLAARILEKEHGIRTLGTDCSRCLRRLLLLRLDVFTSRPTTTRSWRTFALPAERVAYETPSQQHPMSARMTHIYEAYRQLVLQGKSQQPPVIKSASFIAMNEVLAMPVLGAQQATILAPTLTEMCTLQAPAVAGKVYRPSKTYATELPEESLALLKVDPLRADGKAQSIDLDVDFLANGAAQLEKAIQEDSETLRRIKDAVEVFKRPSCKPRRLSRQLWLKSMLLRAA